MNKLPILLIIICILIILYINIDSAYIYMHDIYYKISSSYSYVNNDKNIDMRECKKYKILILSIDNRPNLDFVKLHNWNIREYTKKWNYDYIFIDIIDDKFNVYWYKLYQINKYLKSGKYDYVIWMDSDLIIMDNNTDISNIINTYNNHIIIGRDEYTNVLNAGMFIVKNSVIGNLFMDDCIELMEKRKHNCIVNDNMLKGMWAGVCYEQGIMNELIKDKYYYESTTVPRNIFYNGRKCKNNVFVLHLYGESNDDRAKCFKSVMKSPC